MPVEFLARRDVDGKWLVPDTPLDREEMKAVPSDRVVKVKVTVPRNPKFHRMYFALLSVIYDYMGDDMRAEMGVWSIEQMRQRMKIELGLYTLWVVGKNAPLPEGTPVYIPDSIAFDKMDDADFEKLFKATITLALGKYLRSQSEESLMKMVDNVLRFD